MSNDTRKSILADYDEWTADRTELSEAESSGTEPSSSDWEGSDDTGINLAHRFASLLATDSPDVARDLATDALAHLIRLHITADGTDSNELAFALNGVIRDALSETLDADSTDPVAHTPRADLVMEHYPSWPVIEDALEEARTMSRDTAA